MYCIIYRWTRAVESSDLCFTSMFSASSCVRCSFRFPYRILTGRIRQLFVIFRSVCPRNSNIFCLAFPAAADAENADASKINRGQSAVFRRKKRGRFPFAFPLTPKYLRLWNVRRRDKSSDSMTGHRASKTTSATVSNYLFPPADILSTIFNHATSQDLETSISRFSFDKDTIHVNE